MVLSCLFHNIKLVHLRAGPPFSRSDNFVCLFELDIEIVKQSPVLIKTLPFDVPLRET